LCSCINTIIKTISVCDGQAHSVGGGHGWLAGDTDGWPVSIDARAQNITKLLNFAISGSPKDTTYAMTNNNNNNNPICKAPQCQKTSVALADRNSRAN